MIVELIVQSIHTRTRVSALDADRLFGHSTGESIFSGLVVIGIGDE